MSAALAATGLGIRRGDRWLVRGLDWELRPGELVAITGPSGCGKSSLLAVLGGLAPPDEGAVTRPLPLALAVQDHGLPGDLSLEQAVRCGDLATTPWWRSWWGLPQAGRARARAALDRLGLAAQARRKVRHCSGGERQRAALARLMQRDAPVWLADEPVANLDQGNAERALDLLRGAARAGRAVAVVLHQDDLARSCDRTLRLGGASEELAA